MLDIFAKFNALPYHGEADDIGYTVVFLALDESKFITDQTIQVEGGHYMANPSISDFEQYMAEPRSKETETANSPSRFCGMGSWRSEGTGRILRLSLVIRPPALYGIRWASCRSIF